MDSKMYRFICFILLMSLEGLKADNNSTISTTEVSRNSSMNPTDKSLTTRKSCPAVCCTSEQNVYLFALTLEKLQWLIILFLLLICVLLLLINVCLLCKRCQGTRNNYQVAHKSSITTRRSSLNGRPSETDIMLKDCSSVKVGIETTPDEPDDPQEVAGTAAKTENQVSSEESKNSASDTSEAVPAQEVDQSVENELKLEDVEKAE